MPRALVVIIPPMPYDLVRMMARSQVRASDTERERAVEALRHSFADGRISAPEFEDRVERAYHARTRGELDALFADLPGRRVRGRRRADRPARQRTRGRRVHDLARPLAQARAHQA